MRNRWMASTVAVLALIGCAAALINRSRIMPSPAVSLASPPQILVALEQTPPPIDPGQIVLPLENTKDATPFPVVPGDPAGLPDGSPPSRVAMPGDNLPQAAEADPILAVETFVLRNRKEADDSIKSLTLEAEALRARLAKVEAALARWQGLSTALDPGPKKVWAAPDSVTPPSTVLLKDAGPQTDTFPPPALSVPPPDPATIPVPEPSPLRIPPPRG